jgi:drug/metabolite transporter (DMT)-like permease
MRPAPGASPYVPLAIAVLCVSLGSIFIRMAHAHPLAVSFYRVFFASLLLAPFAAPAARRSWPSLSLRHRLLLLGCGVSLALHFATWVTSLSYTSVAASVLLVNTAPLFTVAFSRVFLGETPAPVVLAATALAFAGAALIALGDWSSAAGAASLTGALLALAGAVTLSIYHVIGRGLRDALPLDAYVLGVWATAAATLGLLGAMARAPFLDYPPPTFGFLLALAVIPTIGGHGLVNLSLRKLPAPVVGLFMLGEPIGASALAYAAFGEAPGLWTLVGGGIVLVALVLVVLGSSR